MTRQRKLSTFLGRTPLGAVMSAVCALLIVLLAACGGGTPNPSLPDTFFVKELPEWK